MKKLFAVLAIIAGLGAAVYSAFFIWFIAMMRGWSHVKNPWSGAWDISCFPEACSHRALPYSCGIRRLR
jgi:hypothetical protein